MRDKERLKLLRTDLEAFLFTRNKRADKERQIAMVKAENLTFFQERKELAKIDKAFRREGVFRSTI